MTSNTTHQPRLLARFATPHIVDPHHTYGSLYYSIEPSSFFFLTIRAYQVLCLYTTNVGRSST